MGETGCKIWKKRACVGELKKKKRTAPARRSVGIGATEEHRLVSRKALADLSDEAAALGGLPPAEGGAIGVDAGA